MRGVGGREEGGTEMGIKKIVLKNKNKRKEKALKATTQ